MDKVYYEQNVYGLNSKEAIKRWVQISKPKEVKKVSKPYFEMEVVKVKKEKPKCEHYKYMVGYVPQGSYYNCPACGEKVYIKSIEAKKPKGTWVNGENLDKIKFPCFCSYVERVTKEKRYGKIDKNWDDIAYKEKYQISKITSQSDEISVLYEDVSLKKLIRNLNIHILRGKIIIYEEEK